MTSIGKRGERLQLERLSGWCLGRSSVGGGSVVLL